MGLKSSAGVYMIVGVQNKLGRRRSDNCRGWELNLSAIIQFHGSKFVWIWFIYRRWKTTGRNEIAGKNREKEIGLLVVQDAEVNLPLNWKGWGSQDGELSGFFLTFTLFLQAILCMIKDINRCFVCFFSHRFMSLLLKSNRYVTKKALVIPKDFKRDIYSHSLRHEEITKCRCLMASQKGSQQWQGSSWFEWNPLLRSISWGEALHWNLARGELLQEDGGGDISESWTEDFGVYRERLSARLFFQKHGCIFSWFQSSRWGDKLN